MKISNIDSFFLKQKEKVMLKYLVYYSLIFIFPIILADVYYIDDIGRVMSGTFNWINDGRPLLAFMAQILSNGEQLMPIFPLPLLLGIGLFDYTIVLLMGKFSPDLDCMLLKTEAMAFCFANLFLLENFSYSFEALGMIIPLSLFSIPFMIYNRINNKISFAVTLTLTILALCFYQALIGWYLGISFIESSLLLRKGRELKEILIRWTQRITPMVLGILLYKVTIAKMLVKGDYDTTHAGIVKIGSYEGILQIINNWYRLAEYLRIYFKSLNIVLLSLLFTLIIFIHYIYIKEYWKNASYSLSKKILSSTLLALIPIFIIISSIAPFLFLKSPVIASRVFISFTAFTFYIGISLYEVGRRYKFVKYVLPMFLIFNLSFSAAYGMGLKREEQHDAQIAHYLVYDMNQIEQSKNFRFEKISIMGIAPKCHEVELLTKTKPLIGRLVPAYLRN